MMKPYAPPGRLNRKWRKLRREPVRFFADAKNPLVRMLGLWGLAGRYLATHPREFRRLTRDERMTLSEALWTLDGPRRRVGARTEISREEYARWIARHDTCTSTGRDLMKAHIRSMRHRPTISILMAVHDTQPAWLDEAIESVLGQIYPEWELCIVDDASANPAIHELLQRHAAAEPRIKWTRRATNGGIVTASNQALSMATGEWVATLDHDDRLAETALFWLADAVDKDPAAAILYSDHDRLTPDGERNNPYFKPDWNYELALGQNFANHLTAFRRSDMLRVVGFRPGFEGSQDWDLLLRLAERSPHGSIRHIPRVLYHWRSTGAGFSQAQAARAWEAGRRAVQEHLDRTGQDAVATVGAANAGYLAVRWRLPAAPPLVSVVIPTRDRVDLLRKCLDGLLHRTVYPRIEIILVDNGSKDAATAAYYQTLRHDPHIRILLEAGDFNFSRMCNRGVSAAAGEVYVLLNNDVDPINPDWLSEMVAHALRPGIGAVGAKLYYPDDTIQHGGVVLGINGLAGHAHKHLPRQADGYHGRARLTQRMPAVTAACLAGRKAIFSELGGLNEEQLKVAFSDVDFCLRLAEAGYAVIWTPFAELWHLESASRRQVTRRSGHHFEGEREWLCQQWQIDEEDISNADSSTSFRRVWGTS